MSHDWDKTGKSATCLALIAIQFILKVTGTYRDKSLCFDHFTPLRLFYGHYFALFSILKFAPDQLTVSLPKLHNVAHAMHSLQCPYD